MSLIQWCCERGAKSHRKRTKTPWRSIKELEIFVSQTFYNFFLFISFFQLLYFNTFFLYFFSPTTFTHTHTHTHTHDPRSLPTTHDPRHLAILVIFGGLISIATLRLRCHDLIYRCLCANPTLFWNTINRMHSYMYFWALFLNKRAAASSIKGCSFAGIAIVQQQNRKKKQCKIGQIL